MAKETAKKPSTSPPPRNEPRTPTTNPNLGDIRGENPNLPTMKNPPPPPPKKTE